MPKPRLLIVSQVLPFPPASGQQQRVFYKLKALRPYFEISFLTNAPPGQVVHIRERLREFCDTSYVLASSYYKHPLSRIFYRVLGELYSLRTGLKLSNFITGQVEFSISRLQKVVKATEFDGVLYEYWHAVESLEFFQNEGLPTILDMHNILWQSLERQLSADSRLPSWWKRRRISQYRSREEQAWNQFNALITINQGEHEYVQNKVDPGVCLFYAPMGTDLTDWPYSWHPGEPARVGYYGGLGSVHNQLDALTCFQEIMPEIWKTYPGAELWIVGSNPPHSIQELPKKDCRVVVTGYVERVQEVLRNMSLLLCPWSGTYGFRSRLIEAMALGIPVIASTDAVYGMGMEEGKGIFLTSDRVQMANKAVSLLENPAQLQLQSQLARQQIENKFSYEATYQTLATHLFEYVNDFSKNKHNN